MSFLKKFTTLLVPAKPGAKRPKARPKPAPARPTYPALTKAELAEAQTKARELIVEAKDQAFQIKRQADLEAQKISQQALVLKDQATQKSAEVDRRLGAVEQREKSVLGQERHLTQARQQLEDLKKQQLEKLEKLAKLSPEQARQLILEKYEKRLTRDVAQLISEAEKEAKAKAETKAKEILVEAMRHGATDYVAEYTVSLVKVADEDMKGRVIGREGRNIRTFEKVTGVELDLDEPGIIRLSSFDPVRREIARVSLEKLIADGRIQPSRIEETVKRVSQDIDRIMRQEGEKLCHAVKVFNLPIEIIDMLGRFKYRFSYGQNMISHTLEETKIGLKLASEVGANPNVVRLGCLLHDIGKVINEEEGTHVEVGVKFLKKFHIPQEVINCVAEHHEDRPFSSIESALVYISDAISGSRPGARYEDHEEYLARMTQLEEIAKSFSGVEEAYALQAGREMRVIVSPKEVDDQTAIKLVNDIRDKIQQEVKSFPGQIKISVIRESRAEAVAK
jgi:ribonuclease Y